MNRREFLKSVFVTTIGAVVLTSCKKVVDQTKKIVGKVTTRKYKDLLDISLLGFGCMRLPIKFSSDEIDLKKFQEMADYAIEHGVNYFDTAYFYQGGKSQVATGKILKKYPRDSYYFANKMPLRSVNVKEDVERIFNDQLDKCQTPYFDFYLAHNINKDRYQTMIDCKVYEQLLEKKKQGKIKYLGFSFHDRPELLEEVIKKYKWDFVQLQINPIDWKSVDAKQQYEIATKYKLPVIVMNPLKGGNLSNLNGKAVELLKNANSEVTPSFWSLRYAGSLPNVFTVLSGMTTLEHVVDNVNTFTNFKPLTEQEQSILYNAIAVYNSSGAISCTYCQYCIECPVGIEIPKIFSAYNQYKTAPKGYEQWSFVNPYEQIPEDKRADKCTNCGLCKTKCPQKLDIPKLLKEIDSLYKKIK